MKHATLLGYWRKAVHKLKGDNCVCCGAPYAKCHHVIYVRRRLLAYDVRNGLPLCDACHRQAHDIPGSERQFLSDEDCDYLDSRATVNLKDYFVAEGLTPEEWRVKMSVRLRGIINDD